VLTSARPVVRPAPGVIVPRLRVVPFGAAAAPGPTATEGPVHRWRAPDGRVTALGYTAGGVRWMHLPGLATFRLDAGDVITAFGADGASGDRIQEVFGRSVLPFALQASGLEVLHASAIVMGPGVVAFCARSGTGKSTLAYGLAGRGHPLWADDAVAFEAAACGPRAIPLPFRLKLRPQSLAHFARRGAPPPPSGPVLPGPSRPLAGVFVLERLQPAVGTAVNVSRLPAGEGLAALLAHAQAFSFGSFGDPAGRRRLAEQYLALIGAVPIFRARFTVDLERLDAVLDGIEGAMG
jgi:hypothetical protein